MASRQPRPQSKIEIFKETMGIKKKKTESEEKEEHGMNGKFVFFPKQCMLLIIV